MEEPRTTFSFAAGARALFLASLTALVVLIGVAPNADAALVANAFEQQGSFGTTVGSGPGEFAENAPTQAAVDDATGNLLAVDAGNNRVQVFSPTVESATYLTEFGASVLSDPYGIAIDETSGDVYVSDAGNNRILRFVSDGAPTPTYTVDATFTSPEQGSGAGQIGDFHAALAVDPANGDVLVADRGNHLVSRYHSNGTFVESFDGSETPPGEFHGPTDVSVSSTGKLVVTDSPTIFGDAYWIHQFSASGHYELSSHPSQEEGGPFVGPEPKAAAFDPNTGLITAIGGLIFYGDLYLWVFDEDHELSATYLSKHVPPYVGIGSPTDVAVDGGAGVAAGRLYALGTITNGEYGNPIIIALKPAYAPLASIGAPTVTDTTAHLSGTVNPNGEAVRWEFQYNAEDGNGWIPVPYPPESMPAGEDPVPVSADVTGLQPGATYEVRLRAVNSAGKVGTSKELSFTTEAGPTPPFVRSMGAAAVTDRTARLAARINPEGEATTYRFEYGTTAAYGATAPAGEPGQAGDGSSTVEVSEEIGGLSAGTTYHFRVLAENASGTAAGSDRTFTTDTAAEANEPARGIELVTPADKGNQNAVHLGAPYPVSADGEHVYWSTIAGTPDSTNGAFPAFISSRTSGGWVAKSLLPPASLQPAEGELAYYLRAASPDLKTFMFQGTEGVVTGGARNYLVRIGVNGESETIAYLGRTWAPNPFHALGGPVPNDAFDEAISGFPDNPNSQFQAGLFAFHAGEKEELNAPACGGYFPADTFTSPASYQPISADASRVFLYSAGDENCEGPRQIYMLDRATNQLTLISGPAVGPPSTGGDVLRSTHFLTTDAAGTTAIYASGSALTANDENNDVDIYRWTASGGNECLTCVVPDADVIDNEAGGIIVSKDLSRVYFTSRKQLLNRKLGVVNGNCVDPSVGCNLYVWHDGAIHYVATAVMEESIGDQGASDHTAEMTPDGGRLVFKSLGATSDPTGGHPQLYLYDAEAESLECISCPKDPAAPVNGIVGKRAFAISADGSTIAFSTSGALDREDINGAPDVYEWHNGVERLVTNGETVWPAATGAGVFPFDAGPSVWGISADGRDVIFSVGAKLTGAEQDPYINAYDARAGSPGFPLSTPPAHCLEDACQGPLAAPPPLTPQGTATFEGREERPVRRHRKKRKHRRHHRHSHKHHAHHRASRRA